MVQQLSWRDRRAHLAEQLPGNYRVPVELDRENQGDDNSERDRKLRERVINYRTLDAKWAAAHPTPEQP